MKYPASEKKINEIEKDEIGDINYKIENARQEISKLKFYNKNNLSAVEDEISSIEEEIDGYHKEYSTVIAKTDSLQNYGSQFILTVSTIDEKKLIYRSSTLLEFINRTICRSLKKPASYLQSCGNC
ncbi:MAG: hypothetical protein U5K00_04565 [Melioribacteraceae bacterium]|nr:hypothetical protein [Melioribacteraceae bacterium]